MKEKRTPKLVSLFIHFLRGRKRKSLRNLQFVLAMASREPTNGNLHLKIAQIYQERGEKQNALQEYLRAGEDFCNSEQYRKAASVYTRVSKEHPELDFLKVKLADLNRKMGFLEEAFTQYYKLFWSYRDTGLEDKSLEILGIMADLDPQKFTLDASRNSDLEGSEKTLKDPVTNGKNAKIKSDLGRPGEKEPPPFFDLAETLEPNGPFELEEFKSITLEEGFKSEEVIKELEKTRNVERLYPNYNYQMGLVCKEVGLIDEAIKQFHLAVAMGQKPVEANNLLDQCIKDKGCLEDCKSFGRTLREEGAYA